MAAKRPEDLLLCHAFRPVRAKSVNQKQVLRSLRSHQDDILRSLRSHQDDSANVNARSEKPENSGIQAFRRECSEQCSLRTS